jgi:hypothetical protein
VLDGVMLNKDVTHPAMRRRIENPRIILLDCPLEYKKGESQISIEVKGDNDWNRVLQLEEEAIRTMCQEVIALKPDLVITEKGLSGTRPQNPQARAQPQTQTHTQTQIHAQTWGGCRSLTTLGLGVCVLWVQTWRSTTLSRPALRPCGACARRTTSASPGACSYTYTHTLAHTPTL